MIVTGRQAASAASAKTSSSPNESFNIADKVRTLTAARAIVPATIPVMKITFDRSRMGVLHIVEVTFTAAIIESAEIATSCWHKTYLEFVALNMLPLCRSGWPCSEDHLCIYIAHPLVHMLFDPKERLGNMWPGTVSNKF